MTENVKVNAQELAQSIRVCLEINKPALIVGAPGAGKSAISKQVALQWLAEQGVANPEDNFLARHAITMLPTDWRGLGAVSENRQYAEWLPYGDLLKIINPNGPAMVIQFDDIGQALGSLQACLMPVLQERVINDFRIRDNVRFILTSNRREDRAGVSLVLEPLKNRCIILELEPSLDAWVRWADEAGLPMEIVLFYKGFPQWLQAFEPSADLTNSPSTRQAETIGAIFRSAPKSLQLAMFAGAIGKAAAMDLVAFLGMVHDMPLIPDVLADPHGARLPDRDKPSVAYALIVGLVKSTNDQTVDIICSYVNRLQPEMQAAYHMMIDRECKAIADNSGQVTRWKAQHSELFS